MKTNRVVPACFSPTGTTRTIVKAIVKGINHHNVELIEITKPSARQKPLITGENDLLIVAVPVYMGRVPSILTDWFNTIRANNTPTVCVVVYGNRHFSTNYGTHNSFEVIQQKIFFLHHSIEEL